MAISLYAPVILLIHSFVDESYVALQIPEKLSLSLFDFSFCARRWTSQVVNHDEGNESQRQYQVLFYARILSDHVLGMPFGALYFLSGPGMGRETGGYAGTALA